MCRKLLFFLLLPVLIIPSALLTEAQLFSTPKNVSNNAGASGFVFPHGVEIAVDSTRNINVVWVDNTPGNYDIFFTRSNDGGVTFSSPKNLSNSPGSSAAAQVAVDSVGDINVLWAEQLQYPNWDIFFSRSIDGGETFSAPKNISNTPGASQFSSGFHLAVDSSGAINVVWIESDNTTGNQDVLFTRSADGGRTFSDPKNLSTTGKATMPSLAVDSSGNINVVWEDNTPGNYDIFYSGSTDGGATFSPPANLSNNPGNSSRAHIALEFNNNINVVWEDNTPGNYDIFFTRSNDGGITFSSPKNLSNSPGSAHGAEIVTDSSGNINVVWQDNGSGDYDIFFTRSADEGTTFAPVKNLSNNPGYSGLFNPPGPSGFQIALYSRGNINVVWGDTTLGNEDIFVTRSSNGGATFSTPQNLSNDLGSSLNPQIAVDSSGVISVVWVDNTSGNYDIFFAGGIVLQIASVTPISSAQGQTITNFTVNGNSFDASAVLAFSGTGITVNSYSSRTATQIVANINIAANAAAGARDVIVTNLDGQTATLPAGFTVVVPTLTLETYSFTLNWTDGLTITPESGFFEFDTTTGQLGAYSFSAPSPFGTLTNTNSQAQLYVNGGPCLSVNPCFGFTIKKPAANNLYAKLEVAFAGSLPSGGGTIVPLTNGAIGRAVCDDACWFSLVEVPNSPPGPFWTELNWTELGGTGGFIASGAVPTNHSWLVTAVRAQARIMDAVKDFQCYSGMLTPAICAGDAGYGTYGPRTTAAVQTLLADQTRGAQKLLPNGWVVNVIDTFGPSGMPVVTTDNNVDYYRWYSVSDVADGTNGWMVAGKANISGTFTNLYLTDDPSRQSELEEKAEVVYGTPIDRANSIAQALNHYYSASDVSQTLEGGAYGSSSLFYLRDKAFPEQVIAAIAIAESGGDPIR